MNLQTLPNPREEGRKRYPISSFINWVVRALNADWLTAQPWYIRPYTTGMTKYFIFTALIMLVTSFYNSNKAPLGFVVYGQYTMAKGCVQALCVASWMRTAHSRGILTIYHTPPGLIAEV
jgi:hypothetical protein